MLLTLEELTHAFSRFSKLSQKLEKHEARLASKLCEASTLFLKGEAISFVWEHIDEAILRCDSCDATPLTTMKVNRFNFLGRRLVRKCKDQGNFCSGRIFLQLPSGETTCVFTEVARLQDKSVWSHVSLMRSILPPLRALGHLGIEVLFKLADRGIFSAYNRHEKQLYKACIFNEPRLGRPTSILDLKAWGVSFACI